MTTAPTYRIREVSVSDNPTVSRSTVIARKWHTVAEVAQMLDYSLSKIKMLVSTEQIRSLKDGRNRRILPEWVDQYISNRVAEAA
jgi:excisionase family DNA binding protein